MNDYLLGPAGVVEAVCVVLGGDVLGGVVLGGGVLGGVGSLGLAVCNMVKGLVTAFTSSGGNPHSSYVAE